MASLSECFSSVAFAALLFEQISVYLYVDWISEGFFLVAFAAS
jgi:hypothetical protein